MWISALLVLLVNDHLLKGSSLPNWLTGKLSDFAGPIVAAVLLAVALRIRSNRGWLLAHLATALGFAAINVSPGCATWVEQLSALTPFPWVITVDPTDLVGLLALPVSLLVLGRANEREGAVVSAWRTWTRRISIPVSAIACMATSAPQEPQEPFQNFPDEPGALAIGNETDEARLIRVRSLRETVEIDCDAVLADPSHALSRDLFGAAETWFLEARRALPLVNSKSTGRCSAYLIETEGMPPTLLAWDHSEFSDGLVPTTTDTRDERMARIAEAGETFLNLQHETAAYLRTPDYATGTCEIAPATVGVDWSTSSGTREITEIVTAPNGCHEVVFAQGADLVLCIPADLPFSVGETISIATSTLFDGSRTADAIALTSDTRALQVVRGSVLPAGTSRVEALESCSLQHDECGNSVRAARIHIGESDEVFANSGETIALPDGTELHLVRVQQMPARDFECAPAADALDYLEYFTTKNITEMP